LTTDSNNDIAKYQYMLPETAHVPKWTDQELDKWLNGGHGA